MTVQFTEAEREELLRAFRTQAEELLSELEGGLLALERAPQDEEVLQAVFRAAHTIKGDARIVGFDEVAQAAHALEDVLEQLREHTVAPVPGLISALLAVSDALREMIAGTTRPEHAAAVAALAAAAAQSASTAAGAVPEESGGQAAATQSRTLRVDVAKLDRMMDLAGEIAIARGRVARLLEALPRKLAEEVVEAHREADRLYFELQEQVMQARMVPIGPFLKGFARPVREAARVAGKQVRLEVRGEEVEVDTRVLELLRDPLIHMVRNAVDHGVEDPESRAALGKATEGCVTLAASHEGGQIVLRLSDDGRGLDPVRIAARARALGLHPQPELLPLSELARFIFAAGFSTADEVTELSGRGVGMDVVHHNIDALRGSIEVESAEGAGTTFTLVLPLTLAIIDTFQVTVGAETYVVPLPTVLECLPHVEEGRARATVTGVLDLRGEAVPYVRLREHFALGAASGRREHAVVVQHRDRRAALVVDELLGSGQAVIKSLDRGLRGSPALAGATILDDGKVALILDVPALLSGITGDASAHSSTLPRPSSQLGAAQ